MNTAKLHKIKVNLPYFGKISIFMIKSQKNTARKMNLGSIFL